MIWEQLLICFGVISVIKYLTYKHRDNVKPFNFMFWIKDNGLDYPVQIFISWLVFKYDHSFLQAIEWAAMKVFNLTIDIPKFEESTFYFVFVPALYTWATYKFLRNKTTKKIVKAEI